MEIYTIKNKKQEEFLRKETTPFDFKKFKKEEIKNLIKLMRQKMKEMDGIGLSANQIGLPYRVFVAQLPDQNGKIKFYAIFNPKIIKTSKEKDIMEEGCLSVPEKSGFVERHSYIVLEGYNMNGKKIKIKAWGLLARVFQHEVDHLDGKLFIDKATKMIE